MLNTHLTTLPKRIDVPTLLISVYANWEYDSIGVDISQLEETGIAHYFCTSTKPMEEWEADFCERAGQEPIGVGESETVAVKNAKLYQWESGLWTWEP